MKLKYISIFALVFVVLTTVTSFALPSLSKIPWSAVGQKIKTVTTSNNTLLPTTMALRSNSQWIAAAQLLTIPVYFYNPALGIAASAVLGYADTAPMDAVQAWNDGKFAGKAAFQSFMDSLFPPQSKAMFDGKNVACSSAFIDLCAGGKVAHLTNPTPILGYDLFPYEATAADGIAYKAAHDGFFNNGTSYQEWDPTIIATSSWKKGLNGIRWQVNYIVGVPTPDSQNIPQTLPADKVDPFLQALRDIMNNQQSPNVPAQTAVKEMLPQYTPPVPAIPAESVTNYNTTNQTNIENATSTYNDTLTNISTSNPTNVDIQIEQAKQEEIGSASPPSLENESLHELDFKPITDLKNALNSHFPFSILNGLTTVLSQLSASPITPEYTIDLNFHQASVDFHSWDNFMSGFRLILGFIFVLFMGFRTVQIWR